MAEKINTQDLISLLSRNSIEKDIADKFIREFFALIEDGLKKDRYVKIKGFGIFKLVDVESRESINVNTGERIEIQGHTKVSFTPDPALKDIINKPFAHFETVILGENVDFANEGIDNIPCNSITELNDTDDDPIVIEIPVIDENIEVENKDIIPVSEILNPEDITEKKVLPEYITGESVISETKDKDNINEKEIDNDLITFPEEIKKEKIKEIMDLDDKSIADDTLTVIQKIPEHRESEKNNLESNNNTAYIQETPSENNIQINQSIKEKRKKNIFRTMFEIFLILLVILFLFLFIYYQDKEKLFNDIKDYAPPFIENLFGFEEDPLHLPISDSVTVDVVEIEEFEPEAEEETEQENPLEEIKPEIKPVRRSDRIVKTPVVPPVYDPTVPVYADSTRYNIVGTKAHHKLLHGETLVQISLRYYGTKDLYPYLIKHNKNKIINPNSIPIGTIIDIPDLELK